MTLRPHAPSSARSIAASALFVAFAVTGIAIATASPEAVVSRSFDLALEESPSLEGAHQPVTTTIAGTEEFWLKEKKPLAGGTVEPAAWAVSPFPFSVAVGDKVTFGSGEARHVLEIVSVVEARNGNAGRSLKISARNPAAPDEPLVTFTTTIEQTAKDGAKPVRSL